MDLTPAYQARASSSCTLRGVGFWLVSLCLLSHLWLVGKWDTCTALSHALDAFLAPTWTGLHAGLPSRS